MVTLIVVPRTSTMAVPLASTPLRATGLRFAITSPSAAMAVPAPTNGRSTADPRATVASVFALRMRWCPIRATVRPGLSEWCRIPVVRRGSHPDWCRGRTFFPCRVVDDVPVTQSVELVLDEGPGRAGPRGLGRPGRGRPAQPGAPRAPSNRPHITLAARSAIDAGLEPPWQRALGDFPLPVRLGALSVFGRDRFVLVRAVVPDLELLRRQVALGDVLGAEGSCRTCGRVTGCRT